MQWAIGKSGPVTPCSGWNRDDSGQLPRVSGGGVTPLLNVEALKNRQAD